MVDVKARWDLLRDHTLAAGIIAVCPLAVWQILDHGKWYLLGTVAVLGLMIGVYVGLRHPLWLYWGLAAVLGGLPAGYFPGVHLPLYLPLAFGAILAAVLYPSEHTVFHPLELAAFALVLVSLLSVVATGHTVTDLAEFIKWTITMLVLFALLRLSRENLARFGRVFVYAAGVNALFGIVIVAADRHERFIRILKPFGYGREQTARFVYSAQGAHKSIRLGAAWIDPNMAGIALVVALVLSLILLQGWRRACFGALFAVAIVLTLSRAAIFTVLFGLVFVLLFHSMRTRDREIAIVSLSVLVVAALLTPKVRHRIFFSFASDDTGTSARMDALRAFPHQMSGHWLFGLGWGRPEFKNGLYAFQLNFVSNAPLLTIYRAGIIAGLAFVVVLVIGCIMSARALRSNSLPYAIYGGVFIAMSLVALQLDHMVVDIPQITLTFSTLLAFLVYVDQARGSPQYDKRPVPEVAGPERAGSPAQ